ncbi:Flavin-dependent oxidoreductase, luciferase family (includes alkanesulfonate monooxygenase SsuD and methylene tetrahydromethanopterin reductase) [Amycolatopsis xylanica]|uniref:Flavin-dependent oxidoreductase, luciferase family (Includes alkanesulfonate monooxygenase SsuD and methylene tetrahydromethanopterin reductase) n=1 Tax=Amycolatopsis xylanica TaxID=589385 RepID=A0A1H3LC27_9PSEU|nr:LLM class flavin-dependent oxidoreductase [Amycolatopsis xylanica]SDY61478.1 Flavin-dependent oxidoreductase, luciferase family (includes alkanesulfonate monooxygenase SsuD and methylene tetrahydromethanopterin reductase) [Amycolatopsis xylanica]
MASSELHFGAAIDGAGYHPAAWRASGVEPAALFTAAHYLTYARLAESAKLDFVTLDDSLGVQPGGSSAVRGRLDALLTFAALGPVTRSIGLVPTVTTTHTEPFHVSTAVATLDHVSQGRAGVLAVPSRTEAEVKHFGRRKLPSASAAQVENTEVIDVIARLWDSWEDDAIIRDEPTGRFIDRDKLHYVDFEGTFFSVKGPSITPRPPQGHPVVATYGENADLLIEGKVLATVSVLLGETEQHALDRRQQLDSLHGTEFRPPGRDFVGTPAALAAALREWSADVDGFLIRPAVLPDDLELFANETVLELRRAGLIREDYTGTTLRDHLGLAKPANQYQGV